MTSAPRATNLTPRPIAEANTKPFRSIRIAPAAIANTLYGIGVNAATSVAHTP